MMDGLMDEWLHSIFQTGLDTLPEPKIFQRKSVVSKWWEEAKILQLQSRGSRGGSRIAQISLMLYGS